MQAHACGHNPLQETNMTTDGARPMSQKRADALRQEWALLLKCGLRQPMVASAKNGAPR